MDFEEHVVEQVPVRDYTGLGAYDDPQLRAIARQLGTWSAKAQTGGFNPSMFVPATGGIYDKMRIAKAAVETDDVIGGSQDTLEGLMWQGLSYESGDADDSDVFNQLAAELDLDTFMRKAYRDLYTYSQVIMASWWDHRTYRPRRRAGERAKRKQYDLHVPTRLVTLDPTQVVPVGDRFWGEDRLAWMVTGDTMQAYTSGDVDPTLRKLTIGRYVPTASEAMELQELGVDPDNLLELNPDRVSRLTRTKADHERFPALRLESTFRLLDLKAQLIAADRAVTVGAASYLLIVKKGNNDRPGTPAEISALKENFRTVAKLPVIVSDHRLSVEIVTPAVDHTLSDEKYSLLNRALLSRVLGAVTLSGQGQRNESSLTVSTLVSRLLESQRHQMKRFLEREISAKVVASNPKAFRDTPSLTFTPNRIQIGTDAELYRQVAEARARREISRESYLELLGYDQEVEFQRRLLEEEVYDDTFGTHIPHDSLEGKNLWANEANNGADGGRPEGS